MTTEELYDKLKLIQKMKCETQNLELKSAERGCPKRLYDSLSSFSNQDDGGIIVFGIDEKQDYKEVGVYDAQDIQKKINEQCLQMNPVVRPLITVVEKENKKFVSAEIPGIDLADRPCYYQGRGRLKGAYTRIGDSDEPMTEYEIYSYEAYRRKYQDDIREVPRVTLMSLDQEEMNRYVELLKRGKQRLATLDNESIYELMSIKRGEKVTLSATLLFSPYPQAYFPQLCIMAIVIPGRTIGSLGDMGERFSDNQRIEGTIPDIEASTDPTFANKVLGDGVVIFPEDGTVMAPCKATVSLVYPTGHAIGLTTADGAEILIHCGVDTVNMNGEGFETLVKEGQEVTAEEALIRFDIDLVKKHGYSPEILVIFTELPEGKTIKTEEKHIAKNDKMAEIV